MMSQADPNAGLTFVVTNTLIARDIRRSAAFYRDVLGATVLHEGRARASRRFSGSATSGSPSTSAAARPMTSLRFLRPRRPIQTFPSGFGPAHFEKTGTLVQDPARIGR